MANVECVVWLPVGFPLNHCTVTDNMDIMSLRMGSEWACGKVNYER